QGSSVLDEFRNMAGDAPLDRASLAGGLRQLDDGIISFEQPVDLADVDVVVAVDMRLRLVDFQHHAAGARQEIQDPAAEGAEVEESMRIHRRSAGYQQVDVMREALASVARMGRPVGSAAFMDGAAYRLVI